MIEDLWKACCEQKVIDPSEDPLVIDCDRESRLSNMLQVAENKDVVLDLDSNELESTAIPEPPVQGDV